MAGFNDVSQFLRESAAQSIERHSGCLAQVLEDFKEETGVGAVNTWDNTTIALFNDRVDETKAVFIGDYDGDAVLV